MMVHPIDWHQQCLTNSKAHLAEERQKLERMRAQVERFETRVSYYESQIGRAIREGKKAFDSEKYKAKI